MRLWFTCNNDRPSPPTRHSRQMDDNAVMDVSAAIDEIETLDHPQNPTI